MRSRGILFPEIMADRVVMPTGVVRYFDNIHTGLSFWSMVYDSQNERMQPADDKHDESS